MQGVAPLCCSPSLPQLCHSFSPMLSFRCLPGPVVPWSAPSLCPAAQPRYKFLQSASLYSTSSLCKLEHTLNCFSAGICPNTRSSRRYAKWHWQGGAHASGSRWRSLAQAMCSAEFDLRIKMGQQPPHDGCWQGDAVAPLRPRQAQRSRAQRLGVIGRQVPHQRGCLGARRAGRTAGPRRVQARAPTRLPTAAGGTKCSLQTKSDRRPPPVPAAP